MECSLLFRRRRRRGLAAAARTRHELAHDDDVGRLGALLPLAGLVLDLGVLSQGLESLASDVAVMDEQILPAILRRDEPVPLCIVEPLDGSGCHKFPLPLT